MTSSMAFFILGSSIMEHLLIGCLTAYSPYLDR
jgi:hypothetical protein